MAVRLFLGMSLVLAFLNGITCGEAWTIPLAGNVYRTAPSPGGNYLRRDGTLRWTDRKEIFSVYFHVDRPCALTLAFIGQLAPSASVVVEFENKQIATLVQHKALSEEYAAGELHIEQPGYVQIDLRGIESSSNEFGRFRELRVTSNDPGLVLDFVRTNEGNMYYWGRRGPSVHLSYQVPSDRNWQYAYSELTVRDADDPIGSFFMANGFAEGYFGMQVNSATERRILFSVWSPFSTDDPQAIPEDQRISLVARGPSVRVGEFGNEGSGGQSVLLYPWKAGRTYRFLTEVRPSGDGSTVYTCWFGDKSESVWHLIASFRRPHTDTYLRGYHSFLESFDPNTGFQSRRCHYSNVWVADSDHNWFECTLARFSVDATGVGRHRLDFSGGSEGKGFFLKNCGFFQADVKPGSKFERVSSAEERPNIDFEQLPR